MQSGSGRSLDTLEAPTGEEGCRWQVASDADSIHALICASDAFHAKPHAPAPLRSAETTRQLVREGSVQVGLSNHEPVATFTLTRHPRFELPPDTFGYTPAPAYLSRLAIKPERLDGGSLLGARCVLRAIELATHDGAERLRAEANPDLAGVVSLLQLFGFALLGAGPPDRGGRRRVYLERALLGR